MSLIKKTLNKFSSTIFEKSVPPYVKTPIKENNELVRHIKKHLKFASIVKMMNISINT